MLGDPLIDWLELYGDKLDTVARQEADDYDADLDFGKFVAEKAAGFRAGIRRIFEERSEVVTIGRNREDAKRLDRARETFAAMRRGAPVIHRAVLRDAEHRAYGMADFLIRSDALRGLFPDDISDAEAAIPAPDLDGNDWHYRVVNAKYMTLDLNASGTELLNGRNVPHKGELYLLNRIVGAIGKATCRPPPTCWDGAGGENRNGKNSKATARWNGWGRFRKTDPSPGSSAWRGS